MSTQDGDVVVTGVGPVTSAGVGADALWSALSSHRPNVARHTLRVDAAVSEELPLAAMPETSAVPGLARHMDFLAGQGCPGYRDLGYALLAIELALKDAGLQYEPGANTLGAIQVFEAPGVERAVEALFERFTAPMPTDAPPRVYEMLAPYFYNSQPFLYVHLVGKAMGFRGFSTSVHNACASGAFAVEIAAERIRSGQADAVIVVGGEAFDTAVRLEWFRRLGLYADDGQMRPFDAESSGFYVGEGAGAMVLESASHAKRRGAKVYATYRGGAFAHQGWKQAMPDVRSARLRDVIVQALASAGVTGGELDLVVPHGASTLLSDGYEASCLGQALDGCPNGAVATVFKPYVGHLLAASGVVEMICGFLAMERGVIPPTLNSRPGHVQLPVPLVTTATERPVNVMLKLSTGFTGHDAAQVFTRE